MTPLFVPPRKLILIPNWYGSFILYAEIPTKRPIFWSIRKTHNQCLNPNHEKVYITVN